VATVAERDEAAVDTISRRSGAAEQMAILAIALSDSGAIVCLARCDRVLAVRQLADQRCTVA
jgi:hypothetical protein